MEEGALTLGAFFYIFPFIEEGNKPGESFQEWNPRGAAKRAHYIAFNVPGAPKSATPKPFLKHRKAAQSPFGLLALFLALFLAHNIAHKSQGRGGAFANFYTLPGSFVWVFLHLSGVYFCKLLHLSGGLSPHFTTPLGGVIYNQKAPPTWAESNGELLRIFTAIYAQEAAKIYGGLRRTRAPSSPFR